MTASNPSPSVRTNVPEQSALDSAPAASRNGGTMMLAALGVVFGDIGTSPLYAMRESFIGPHPLPIDRAHILGVLSLIFWTITLIVSFKYVAIMMRADNRGEGGSLAMVAILERVAAGRPIAAAVATLGILAAALFYGDSMITPAISVLSAVEGLKVATPHLELFIVPITVAIVIGLFLLQRHGAGAIGRCFGPIMLVWFVTLGVIGLMSIAKGPHVLLALSPSYAVMFIVHDGVRAFLAFGSVFLAVTGAEALYADMGHFGRLPIRLAWYGIALPGLLLNYFGQGALLLGNASAIDDPFIRLVPHVFALPMVILAAIATVIASQAVISGAFSVTQQAVHFGYLPRLRTVYTSEHERGQIYIPIVNWGLLAAVIALVIGFGSSTSLASAYGIAVSGTMTLSTVLLSIVAIYAWHWSRRKTILVLGLLFVIDFAFLLANATKIPYGGWFPLAIGLVIYAILTTWKAGRALLMKAENTEAVTIDDLLPSLQGITRVEGSAIFLTSDSAGVPAALLHNIKHNKVLHEHNILLTVRIEDHARVTPDEHLEYEDLGHGFRRLVLKYGYLDMIDIPRSLAHAKESELGFFYFPMAVSYFISRETLIAAPGGGMSTLRKKLFILMWRTAVSPMEFFRLPTNRVVELGAQAWL
jgi:KUP system potassium uptake protein